MKVSAKKFALLTAAILAMIAPLAAQAEEAKVENAPSKTTQSRPSPKISVPTIDLDKESPESSNVISFNLKPRQVELTKDQKAFLLENALPVLRNNPDINLIIQTLARSNPKDRYEKTRIALARGLEVRQFFLDYDISPKRLKTQPLPVDGQRGEDDRIDLIFTR